MIGPGSTFFRPITGKTIYDLYPPTSAFRSLFSFFRRRFSSPFSAKHSSLLPAPNVNENDAAAMNDDDLRAEKLDMGACFGLDPRPPLGMSSYSTSALSVRKSVIFSWPILSLK